MDNLYRDIIMKKLKSTISLEKVYVRFINKSCRTVDVMWINYEGDPTKYYTLAPDTYADINTFVGHPWIFEDSVTRDRLSVNKEYVFFPPSWKEIKRRMKELHNDEAEVPQHRIIVMISLPVYDLRQRCLQVVRDTLDCLKYLKNCPNHLPKTVEDDLMIMLLKKDWEQNIV